MKLRKTTDAWFTPHVALPGIAFIVAGSTLIAGAWGFGVLTGGSEFGHFQQRIAVISLVLFAIGIASLAMWRASLLSRLAMIVPLLIFGGGVMYVFPFEVDDAYISMRYAQHLAEGQGLVFSVGGPRVEGYTNLLLVLMEAALMKLGLYDLWPVKLITTGCGILTLLAIGWYANRRLDGATNDQFSTNILVGAILLITASSSPVLLWSTGGLETMLFACLICLSALLYCAYLLRWLNPLQTWLIDIVLILAILTRPEGLLFWMLTSVHTLALWLFFRQHPSKARLAGLATSTAIIIAYAIWKQIYFGQLLPLTYLAKETSFSLSVILGGGKRFAEFLAINGNFFILGLLALGLLWALRSRVSAKAPFWYLFSLIAAYGAYVLSRGFRVAMDDAYRLWVPVIPLLSVLAAEVAHSFLIRSSSAPSNAGRHALIVATITALAILLPIRVYDLRTAWTSDLNWNALWYRVSGREIAYGLQDGHIRLGKWLQANAAPDATIVLFDAGAIPYFSGLRTIDTWSLSDPTIIDYRRALSKSQSPEDMERVMEQLRSYVMQQQPDYIIQDNLQLMDNPAVRDAYQDLGIDFKYLSDYVLTPKIRISPQ